MLALYFCPEQKLAEQRSSCPAEAGHVRATLPVPTLLVSTAYARGLSLLPLLVKGKMLDQGKRGLD